MDDWIWMWNAWKRFWRQHNPWYSKAFLSYTAKWCYKSRERAESEIPACFLWSGFMLANRDALPARIRVSFKSGLHSIKWNKVFCLLEPLLFKRFILPSYITTLMGKNDHFNGYRTFFVFSSFLAFTLKTIQGHNTRRNTVLRLQRGLIFFFFSSQTITDGRRQRLSSVQRRRLAKLEGGESGREGSLSWASHLWGLNERRTGSSDLLSATKTNVPNDTDHHMG